MSDDRIHPAASLGFEVAVEHYERGRPTYPDDAVTYLVRELGMAQPQVSKHLRVLREVGAVDVRDEGRQRLYRLNGHALKPIHDWVKSYERTWAERFEQLDIVLDELKKEQGDDGSAD